MTKQQREPALEHSNGSLLRRFIEWEASAGLILVISAILALIIANSDLSDEYFAFQQWPIFTKLPHLPFHLPGNLLLFINDFLMAIFFLFVGLGIKNEFVLGELSTFDRGVLPFIAAVFGMIVPAAIYFAINIDHPENYSGWAIPSATDIAFAIGAIALLGKRVPSSLRVLLVAIAVIDDLGAIIIIAVFYSDTLHLLPLLLAAGCLTVLYGFNRLGITNLAPYLIVGVVIWFAIHESGIHATIAGVLLALTIPCRTKPQQSVKSAAKQTSQLAPTESPLLRLEKALSSWVNFLILPLFGFFNAGVVVAGFSLQTLLDPLPLGIILGLFLGKQIGIFGSVYVCIKLRLISAPANTDFLHIYGIALLCGIGFTMSLFIGGLSFDNPLQATGVRIGVLFGSLIAFVFGYLLLRFAPTVATSQPAAASNKAV